MIEANQKAFLAAYAEVGNITKAAKMAEITRDAHYKWLANDSDGTYVAAFKEAEEQAIEKLEQEARRRAVEGMKRKKFDSKGNPVIDPETGQQYEEYEYSDTLLIFLLKGAKPEKYRENRNIALTGANGGPVQVQTFRELTDDELDGEISKLAGLTD